MAPLNFLPSLAAYPHLDAIKIAWIFRGFVSSVTRKLGKRQSAERSHPVFVLFLCDLERKGSGRRLSKSTPNTLASKPRSMM